VHHQHFGVNFHPLAFEIVADLVTDTVVDLGLLILEVGFFSARQGLPIKLRLPTSVGRNLIAIVRELGYSGAEVARYLGVTNSCVTRIVTSGTKPPVEELIKEL
jgi:hypothetical protein